MTRWFVQALPTLAAAGLALAACSSGGGGPVGPPVALASGQDARVVIGQADFTSGQANRGGAVAADGLNYPAGGPAAIDGRLYVPDTWNNRVLGFDAIPGANGAAADFVLGQAGMTTGASGRSATAFFYPTSVSSSAGKLVISDAFNERVLVWNAVPTATNVAADVVVGKATMASGFDPACGATNISVAHGACAAGGRLVASDFGHTRVLVWSQLPTADGQAADVVLGQPDLATCGPSAGVSASSISGPQATWSDGTRLIVADSDNRRVLVWTSFPTASGEPADVVLGQADFSSTASGLGAAGMNDPSGVTSNGVQVAVADRGANRVLVWNTFPATNGQPADVVLGQPDFSSGAPGTTAAAMRGPMGVLLHGDMLIVADTGNNRLLVFE